jgi:hypothetical protein
MSTVPMSQPSSVPEPDFSVKSTVRPTRSATRAVSGPFVDLVDDAALFPPEKAPMAAALAGHREHRGAWYADLVGPFLCPVAQLGELREELDRSPDSSSGRKGPLELGLIAGVLDDDGRTALVAALAVVADDPRLELRAVEAALRAPTGKSAGKPLAPQVADTLAALPDDPDVDCYVELPRVDGWLAEGWQDALAALTRHSAKLRTGGPTAEAFPSEAEVAAFVHWCVAEEVQFKCTAGLHRAVRNDDAETGFAHHGFLNVLLATYRATQDADVRAVTAELARTDGEAMAAEVRGLGDELEVARAYFLCFGSCSVREPQEDLSGLGLL